jgi:HK97 family phage portal protein
MWLPFRKKALTGTPEMLDALRDRQWAPWPVLGGGSRQRILDAFNTAQSANYAWIYINSPAVRTNVDVIVRNVGQLDLRLYEEVDESERQPKPDHPAALSLRYPSETVTSDALIRSLFKDFLLFDNAYALLIPGTGNQISLFRVPAHMVEIRGASLWEAEGYRVHLRDGSFADYTPEQMLHWRGENPNDPRMGVSRLDTLRGVIAEDAALQAAIVELANSGMTEPVWAFRPLEAPELSGPAEAGLEEDLTNRIHRRNRRVVVTQEGTELRSFGVSPKDAQMLEVRRWAIERVAAVYGNPLGMVGLDDNLEEARAAFYSDTLPPYCEEFTKMLNLRVLVRVYNWTKGCFEFNLDEKHMGDDRIKALVSATGRPVMLTNEGRARLNLPPVKGGDDLVTPDNVTAGDKPKPSVDVMPIQDPNKPAQDGSYRENPKALAKTADGFEPVPQLDPARRDDLERQLRNVDACQAVIQRHFTRLSRSLRDKSRKAQPEADWNRWDREFADDIHVAIEQIVEREGSVYSFKLAGGDFDMRRVKNYLRAMAEGAAAGINDKIRQEIQQGGLDVALARVPQHVESAGASLGAHATTWAREEAAKQAPGAAHRVKTWIPHTNRHAAFGGQTVPLGDQWPAGFAPGTAPGCKCSMAID